MTDKNCFINDTSSDYQTSSIIPLHIRKNVTIIPISKIPKESSKINNKRVEPLDCQLKQSNTFSNFKISKEVTATPIKTKESNIVSLLKKLPDITFNLVKSEPLFKVPETPKYVKKSTNKNILSKNVSNVIFEKKVLSERQDDNIIDTNLDKSCIKNISENNSNHKRKPKSKQKQININSLMKNNTNKIILKNSEKSLSYAEKENIKRTSSPNKLPKKSQFFSKIKEKKFKITKPLQEVLNISTESQGMKISSTNDSILNNTVTKINESIKEDYTLMDLSTDGKINIIPAFRPFDSIDIPEYDTFVIGIDNSSEDSNTQSETSQNYKEKKSLIGQELIQITDLLNY